jgi:hypothetical protein
MKGVAQRALKPTILVTVITLLGATALVVMLERAHPAPERRHYYEFYLSIFKLIVGGFLVAMLGILIPNAISETKYNFKKLRASKIAYSKAKTGIDYLKLRLSTMNLVEAVALLEKVHYHKHYAQLFDEFEEHLKKRYDSDHELRNPDKWDEVMYTRLFVTREILEKNADNWDAMTRKGRIALLNDALPTVSEIHSDPRPPSKSETNRSIISKMMLMTSELLKNFRSQHKSN